MAFFKYRARDKFGKLARGVIETDRGESVDSRLKEMGYTPISIEAKKKEDKLFEFLKRFRSVKSSDLNMFTRQLMVLQRTGIPLLSSLGTIKNQTGSGILKVTLDQVARDVESGSSFSGALAKHPRVFNELFVNMIGAGEVGGVLDEALERLTILGEYEERTKSKIKAAIRYPVMVVCALVIAFLVLTTYAVPHFVNLFAQFDTPLPLPTRILMWMSYAITKLWWLILILAAFFVFLFRKIINMDAGRFWWDNLTLKIPIFGPLFTKIIMSRFARVMATLTRGGVSILRILELTSKGAGNVVIARTIDTIKKSVNEGEGMSEPMKKSGMFPPLVIQMVSVGEETGKLDELLFNVSDYYDLQINYTIDNLTSLIEPILVVVLGLGVLFTALAVFLPIWGIYSSLAK